MRHFGDNSNPSSKDRFMADADSISIGDTDEDTKKHLEGVDLGKKAAATKPLRTKADVWDVDVVPDVD